MLDNVKNERALSRQLRAKSRIRQAEERSFRARQRQLHRLGRVSRRSGLQQTELVAAQSSQSHPVFLGTDTNPPAVTTLPKQEEFQVMTGADKVEFYMENYLKAHRELSVQRRLLIELRGSEENLTDDDRDALENIRDLVAATYEQLLDT